MKKVKYHIPQIGIMPREIFYQDYATVQIPKEILRKRIFDIKECIIRRMLNDDDLDVEWVKEYNVAIDCYDKMD